MYRRKRYNYKELQPEKDTGEIKYYINDIRVSKRQWDEAKAFHKKYDSYPRVKKTCLNCNLEYYAIEELLDKCPFCKAPHDYDPKAIMEKLREK